MNMFFRSRLVTILVSTCMTLGGCANLPSSGPTGSQIYKAQDSEDNTLGFRIVEVSSMDALPASTNHSFASLPAPGFLNPSNLIGPNDVLDVAVYEAGISLFAGGSGFESIGGSAMPAVRAERLPAVDVDDDGFITIPYAGRVKAAGHTTTELARIIADALAGRSANPEVVVRLNRSITNSVMLSGEVARSGRLPLETNRETILDVISLAGGYRGDPSDIIVRIERNDHVNQIRLDELQRTIAGEIRAFPGDRITLLRDPESFSVMGAAGQTAQIPFNRPQMSLAEAIARAGGSDDNQGDPAAIFVFRFVREGEAEEKPVVYHLNMMKAGSYFLAQKFVMRDRDILFVGNAGANQPRKMVQTLSQLFTPVATARAVTR